MDPLTHGLASLAMQRGFFPRTPWRGVLVIIAAGTIADMDSFSSSFGPSAYLRWHRTATHSLSFVIVFTLAAFLFSRIPFGTKPNAPSAEFSWIAVAFASSLHIVMDLLQADTVAPLWPFSARRFSCDISPAIDPWLLIILAAAILFPELFRLVNDEITSRTKRPRGRTGAIAGLSFALIYFAARALFHGNAVAALEARTVSGEMPRRVGAFPDSASPFLWHCVVETESALHLADLRSLGGGVAYASGITTLRKPEPSPMLTAAQSSPAAISFLKIARFPKAVVEKEAEGYSVEINDLKDRATEEKNRSIFAGINLDNAANVVSSGLQWQKSAGPP
ncbi:MAG TPA: metal-dependent hydrolase [Candidatus Acidoferrum sp.]